MIPIVPQDVSKLPEYDNETCFCPKCNGKGANVSYDCREAIDGSSVEWLIRECHNCYFQWFERCADWEENV